MGICASSGCCAPGIVRRITHGPIAEANGRGDAVIVARADASNLDDFSHLRMTLYYKPIADKEKAELFREEVDSDPVKEPPESMDTKNMTAVTVTMSVDECEEADFVFRFHLSNLRPDSLYLYSVGGAEHTGLFRTPPAAASPSSSNERKESQPRQLEFFFSSCVGGQGFGRPQQDGWRVFANMLKVAYPDFLLHLGDTIYADDAVSPDGSPHATGTAMVVSHGVDKPCSNLRSFLDRYKYALEDPDYARLLRSTNTFAVWDDHDLFNDWGREELEAQGEEKRQYVREGLRAFLTYWPVFTDGGAGLDLLPPPLGPIYRQRSLGPVADLFILDARYCRGKHELHEGDPVPYMRTMLGEEQCEWLVSAVSRSQARWKFIASSVPLSWPTGYPNPERKGYDGWSDRGAQRELTTILSKWHAKSVKNIVFLSGDCHFPHCLSHRPFGDKGEEIWELGSSPMVALPLSPPPEGPMHARGLGTTVHYAGERRVPNFAYVGVNLERLIFRVFGAEDGSELYSKTILSAK